MNSVKPMLARLVFHALSSTPLLTTWARSPMDRTMVSEAVGTGSIPVGPTGVFDFSMKP